MNTILWTFIVLTAISLQIYWWEHGNQLINAIMWAFLAGYWVRPHWDQFWQYLNRKLDEWSGVF